MSNKHIAALLLWIPTIICGAIIVFQWQTGRQDKEIAVAEARAAAEESLAAEEDLAIEPLVGVGPIKFGMSSGEVIKLLGEPNGVMTEPEDTSEVVGLDYIPAKGICLIIRDDSVVIIDCYSSNNPTPFESITSFSGTTEEGIGMGSTRDEVYAAFGEPEETYLVSTDTQETTHMLCYDKLMMEMAIWQGEVITISISGPSSISEY